MTTYRIALTKQREERGRTPALVLVVEGTVALLVLLGCGNKRLPRVSLRKVLKLLSVVNLVTLCRVCLEEVSNETTAA